MSSVDFSTAPNPRTIVTDIARRREAGEPISDDAVLAANPHIPEHELRVELDRLRRITNAQQNLTVKWNGTNHGAEADQLHAPPGSASDSDDLKDHILPETISRYRPVEFIGEGGFGTVFRAYDPQHDCHVALKISKTAILTREQETLFFREARAAAQLDHPGIVHIRDSGRDGDRFFIVSEYVEGSTLEEMIADKSISMEQAVQFAIEVCDALIHAHSRGVIHRDLKPANVIVDRSGQPRLMDFGLAKRTDNEATITTDGNLIGTIPYMSPQQADGAGRLVDGRADIYSLGVILFEMITGERPFRGTPIMICRQVLSDDPPSPRTLNDKIALDLETIVLSCLEKDPNNRLDAVELRDELVRFRKGEPINIRPVSSVERLWRWSKRRPAMSGLILAVSLLIAMAFTAGAREFYTQRRAKTQLGDNMLTTAELYGRRGEWQKALEQIDSADSLGLEDAVRLSIARLKALSALNRVQEARDLLEVLVKRSDLGEQRAKVIFLEGMSLLTQGESTRGVALLREAKQIGALAPADVALIDAITALDSPTALKHFERSLAFDPFSHEGYCFVVFALSMAGRDEEAIQRANVAMLIFPDDPNLPLLAAFIESKRGNRKQARKYLETRACQQLKPDLLKNYRTIIEELPLAYRATFELWDIDPPDGYLKVSGTELEAAKKIQAAVAAIGSYETDASGLTGLLGLMENRGPICYQPAFKILDDLVSLQTIGFLAHGDGDLERIDSIIRGLEASATTHPDSYFDFCRGRLLCGRGKLSDATEAFARAAARKSMFGDIAKLACYAAAQCEYERFAKKEQVSLERAREFVRKRLTYGEISHAHAEKLLIIAIGAKDFDSARKLVASLDKRTLGEDKLNKRRAEIEFAAGEYLTAAKLASQVADDSPAYESAQQMVVECHRLLRDIVAKGEARSQEKSVLP